MKTKGQISFDFFLSVHLFNVFPVHSDDRKMSATGLFRRLGTIAAIAFLGVWIAVLGMANPSIACSDLEFPVSWMIAGGKRIQVEIAATPRSRACGLSQRTHLSQDRGMLFVYPTDRHLTFWMKNTFIPLSIAFLDKGGRILSIQQMTPNQIDERYHSPGPARYSLEMNQGWFAVNDLKIGDRVTLNLPLDLDIR